MSEDERRTLARKHLDSTEAWLRRLIDHQLRNAFGPDYFAAKHPDGNFVVQKRIVETAEAKRMAEPHRFARPVDALTLKDAIDIVLHEPLYLSLFRVALSSAYPDGREEARTFLERLLPPRNNVQHGGTISSRDLERCICYSNDLIDGIKAFFVGLGMGRTFNVPLFTRVVDNLGNETHFTTSEQEQEKFVDFRGGPDLYPGDRLIIETEIDPTFSGYTVRHWVTNDDMGEGATLDLQILTKHVGEIVDVRFEVTSAEEWHRLVGCDDRLDVRYRVLPPVK